MSDIMEPSTIVGELRGHSGCKVVICRSGDEHWIRKTSGSPAYNHRLVGQIEKQRRLASIMPVARVIRASEQGGLAFYDMEFIPGRDMRSQCETEPAFWIYGFIDRLFDLFKRFASTPKSEDISQALSAKALSVQSAVRLHALYETFQGDIDAALSMVLSAKWAGTPSTECHGDFTLENMIFQANGEITFIDVLDGDLDTFWLDIAKLLFDMELGWSLRSTLWGDALSPEARLLWMISRHIREEVLVRLSDEFPLILDYLPHLKALQALRILPYTDDVRTFGKLVTFLASQTKREPM